MPKSTTPPKLIKILESHGFEFRRQRGSHRIYLHPTTQHRVVVPMHRKDIPTGTLRAILKQAHLSIDDLK